MNAATSDRASIGAGGLAIDRVSVRYGARLALRPVMLSLARGELVALVGPNGAGKSSLLKAIAGLVPHAGSVSLDGEKLAPLPPRERARKLAYLPQTPAAHWPMRTADLIALGRLPHRRLGEPESPADREALRWAMEQTGTTQLAARRVDELSAGELTRVLLGRALAVRAPVLLADEPVASLDPYHQLSIIDVLAACARRGALVVVVLHDLALAARFCTRIVLLSDGEVAGDGTPDEVLSERAIEAHYRVQPYIARHENEPVILPWRTLR
jgi:iron complex transport system ATP-binding protein